LLGKVTTHYSMSLRSRMWVGSRDCTALFFYEVNLRNALPPCFITLNNTTVRLCTKFTNLVAVPSREFRLKNPSGWKSSVIRRICGDLYGCAFYQKSWPRILRPDYSFTANMIGYLRAIHRNLEVDLYAICLTPSALNLSHSLYNPPK
jgi:hypothetical protein